MKLNFSQDSFCLCLVTFPLGLGAKLLRTRFLPLHQQSEGKQFT